MPDLGVIGKGYRFAIEVELHSKAPDRLRGILHGYRWKIEQGTLGGVAYVTTRPAVARLVRREGDRAMLRDHLHLIELHEMIEMARSRATGDS